ncbi:ATPase family associated with various cellular activities (AAA) [Chitinophaga ginsengisegetis]|uniref:ATPase family associated with various cellular activities (AAA) n=2 Tax=Chitinophagaceae TaxID=563835 RepID=A0A1T5NCR2_9BACT|nr:ATPase family associated with various cellular activities (AAA) [Chitinophaga ginsengisegetis]
MLFQCFFGEAGILFLSTYYIYPQLPNRCYPELLMKKTITRGNMFRQLKADLGGKDSYRGVTLTYTWLANQFGHFSLGFIPAFILYLVLKNRMEETRAALTAAWSISAVWLVFEAINFLWPLTFGKKGGVKSYIFQPAWGNVAFDTITDLLFFWLGAFFCSLLCRDTTVARVVVIVTAALLVYPTYYWYLTKMYLQTPGYPFQFRLSQWSTEQIAPEDIDLIRRFLDSNTQGMHLFLFGPKNSGKTSLSVAIATELSIRHYSAVYTSAMKLYCMFYEQDDDSTADVLWTWRKASILVIDDINPGNPVKEDLITSDRFLSFVDGSSTNDINRTALKDTNVIWVLGNDDQDRKLSATWQNMLHSIGVEREKMLSLNLERYVRKNKAAKAEYDLQMQS